MHLMLADEADQDGGQAAEFFVCGAIFIPSAQAAGLSAAIEAMRQRRGWLAGDQLKFADRFRPERIDRAAHLAAKQEVLEISAASGVIFSGVVTLHELARNRTQEELVTWGANTLLRAFNTYLIDRDSHGVVLFDRMPIRAEHRFFREKFTTGLVYPGGREERLDRVLALGSTCDGASHFSSVADIVLGGFRYCVNEPHRDVAGRAILPHVLQLMWRRDDGLIALNERGFIMRPLQMAAQHRARYDALRNRLNGYLAAVD